MLQLTTFVPRTQLTTSDRQQCCVQCSTVQCVQRNSAAQCTLYCQALPLPHCTVGKLPAVTLRPGHLHPRPPSSYAPHLYCTVLYIILQITPLLYLCALCLVCCQHKTTFTQNLHSYKLSFHSVFYKFESICNERS